MKLDNSLMSLTYIFCDLLLLTSLSFKSLMNYLQGLREVRVSFYSKFICEYFEINIKWFNEISYKLSHKSHFWHKNLFKIVPVQLALKWEIWEHYVTFVFVLAYLLKALSRCVIFNLRAYHHLLVYMFMSS